jgi:SAM-dependent methyltransferase
VDLPRRKERAASERGLDGKKTARLLVELKPRGFRQPGPDPMTTADRVAFFDFYKKHRSRRLFGFLRDISRSSVNNVILSQFLGRKKNVRCLLVGCSHWANPIDLVEFVKGFNVHASVDVAALDLLPDALLEGIRRSVPFVPLLSPAQETPFCDESFDILVADGLLNCCCFEQHEPIVREMHRISRRKAILLLGLSNSPRDRVVKWSERPITAYCRPLKSFKDLFHRCGFSFPQGSSITTPFLEGSEITTDNCIARKRA